MPQANVVLATLPDSWPADAKTIEWRVHSEKKKIHWLKLKPWFFFPPLARVPSLRAACAVGQI